MATCGNPFLNECPLEGLRQGTCATPWFQHFLGFIFVLQCFHHMSMLFFVCVLVLFFGPAPGPAPYIYIYIYGISDAPAPRSAPTFFHMRRSHFLCVSSFLNAIMPLYMQAIFFSLSISLIFPLCSPHIFYVLSGHSLDRPAPVIPIVSWLVISFTFPLPPPLILPIYVQNVTCARPAPVTFFEVVLAHYFPYIVPMFCYFSL